MFTSQADIVMSAPERCMLRLCKHWSQKFQVRYDETSAHIPFDPAVCELLVIESGLRATLQTPDREELVELQRVVADHLQRMAGEPLQADWHS